MATGSLGRGRAYADLDEPHGVGPSSGARRGGLLGWFSNLPAQAKGLIALVLIFGMMGAQSAFAFRMSLESQATSRWVAHSTEVLGASAGAFAESGRAMRRRAS